MCAAQKSKSAIIANLDHCSPFFEIGTFHRIKLQRFAEYFFAFNNPVPRVFFPQPLSVRSSQPQPNPNGGNPSRGPRSALPGSPRKGGSMCRSRRFLVSLGGPGRSRRRPGVADDRAFFSVPIWGPRQGRCHPWVPVSARAVSDAVASSAAGVRSRCKRRCGRDLPRRRQCLRLVLAGGGTGSAGAGRLKPPRCTSLLGCCG